MVRLGVITPSGTIKTLEDLRSVIEAAIETYEEMKVKEDEVGTSQSVLFEFAKEDGVFGYCEDCEERCYDEPPMRDESRD